MFEDSRKKVAESVFKEKLLRKLVEDSYGVTGESKNIAKFHFRLSSLFPNSYIWFQPRYLTNPYSIQSPIPSFIYTSVPISSSFLVLIPGNTSFCRNSYTSYCTISIPVSIPDLLSFCHKL